MIGAGRPVLEVVVVVSPAAVAPRSATSAARTAASRVTSTIATTRARWFDDVSSFTWSPRDVSTHGAEDRFGSQCTASAERKAQISEEALKRPSGLEGGRLNSASSG